MAKRKLAIKKMRMFLERKFIKINFKVISYIFLFKVYLLNPSETFAADILDKKIIDQAKKSVVTIKTRLNVDTLPDGEQQFSIYPYIRNSCVFSLGVIVNKTKGIILTSDISVLRGAKTNIKVIFNNGREANAKVIYYDPWIHYAYLKVNPENFPSKSQEVKFAKEDIDFDKDVFTISNYYSKDLYFIYEGKIENFYYTSNLLSQHSYLIDFFKDIKSLSSPIFNRKGELVSITYLSRNKTLALHLGYLKYSLQSIENNQIPKRKHIGAIFDYYFLPQGTKCRKFPESLIKKNYLKLFKKTGMHGLEVVSILKGTPAEGKLLYGDIVWSINGELIGGNLFGLDMLMNTTNKPLLFEIIRKGKIIKIEINIYDLEKNKIQEYIHYGGNIIFKIDDRWARILDEPAGSLFLKSRLDYSPMQILSFNGKKIFSMEKIYDLLLKNINNKIILNVKRIGDFYLGSFGDVTFQKRYQKEILYSSSLMKEPKHFLLTKTNNEAKANY